MRTALLLPIAFVAACGGDAASPPDARAIDAHGADAALPDAAAAAPDAGLDLACANDPPPSTAADPIAITGTVFAVVDFQPQAVAGATVELRARADDALLGSATSDDDGHFAISAASGGVPVAAAIDVAVDGELPTRELPADPLVGGEHVLVIVASAAEVGTWYAQSGATFDAATDRTVLAAITDCDGASARGGTVAVAPAPGAFAYYDDQAHDWNPALSASVNGYALAAAAAATSSVSGAVDGVALPARDVPAAVGALTIAVVSPRR